MTAFFVLCAQVDVPSSQPGSFFGGFHEAIIKTNSTWPLASSSSATGFYNVAFTSAGASVSPLVFPGLGDDSCVEAVSVGWKHMIALVKDQ